MASITNTLTDQRSILVRRHREKIQTHLNANMSCSILDCREGGGSQARGGQVQIKGLVDADGLPHCT